jgi:hypothetical protein
VTSDTVQIFCNHSLRSKAQTLWLDYPIIYMFASHLDMHFSKACLRTCLTATGCMFVLVVSTACMFVSKLKSAL